MAVLFSCRCKVLAKVLACDRLNVVRAEAVACLTTLVLSLADMMNQCKQNDMKRSLEVEIQRKVKI